MPHISYRIFLSYRGKSAGEAFSERLYKHLVDNPECYNMHGNVYFSPKILKRNPDGNYKRDIPEIMKDVEYFVLPLTKGFFSDFWDKDKDCPNINSITYLEIVSAIENGSKFICIVFPGYEDDKALLKKIFKDDAELISCSQLLKYDNENEEEVIRLVSDAMIREDYKAKGAAELLANITPNVLLSFRKDTENPDDYPLYQILHDVTKITLLNFAASSFISGIDIATIYEKSDYWKRWFDFQLSQGKIEADIIITDPHSIAAKDAALYKMYPSGSKVKKDEIILKNMNRIFQFMKKYPSARLNIYLTNITLPYGVMMTENVKRANNYIKVDLYSAVINHDENRPSFFLLQNNKETAGLYSFFKNNVMEIMNNHSYAFNGHPKISWLKKKHIIHRGVIRQGLKPHTKSAFEACIEEKYPIEVDLLALKDGTVIVGREDQDVEQYGYSKPLSEFTVTDLRKLNQKVGPDKILTLEEFLELINGKIPVLLEIKSNDTENSDETAGFVRKVVRLLHQYTKRCVSVFNENYGEHELGFAIHSSNPYVLCMIKELDCLIPCGIISTDFSNRRSAMGEELYSIHADKRFPDIITPDFISYNINYLDDLVAVKICEDLDIPLLGWTVTDEEGQNIANDYRCDNIIIEGAKSFK